MTTTEREYQETTNQSTNQKEIAMNTKTSTSFEITNPDAVFRLEDPPIVINNDKLDIAASLSNVKRLASNWYQSSTKQLYSILGECYELYYLIESATAEDRDNYKDLVKEAYDKLGGGQGYNNLRNGIVSVVFNFPDLDRKQRSRYATLLKRAHDAATEPSNSVEFVTWIEAQGGIIAALSKNSVTRRNKLSQSEINSKVRALPAKARVSLPNSGNRFSVLLAQGVDGNTLDILYQFEDDKLCEQIAARVQKEIEKTAKQSKQVTAEDLVAALQPQDEEAAKEAA